MFQSELDAQELERQVRNRLAASLEHVFERAGRRLQVGRPDTIRTLDRIGRARVPPGVFSRYFDLVFAIEADDWGQARRLASEIVALDDNAVAFEIIPYAKDDLGDDYERFARLAFATFSENNPMAPPDRLVFESHRAKVDQAVEIVRDVDPAIHREIQALLSRVIVAVRDPAAPCGFGGVSSLMIWGAVFMNAERYASLYQVVEFLVHEITHHVLFAHGALEPLVRNPPTETFYSPLRQTPRPMDGVYHATLVCARLCSFARKCLEHRPLDTEGVEWAESTLEHSPGRFCDGAMVVRDKGQLSEQGWAFLEAAETEVDACQR